MNKDLYVVFPEGYEVIKGLRNSYSITVLDEVKKSIDSELFSQGTPKKINYEIWMSGSKAMTGTMMFGLEKTIPFESVVERTLEKVTANTSEKEKFLNTFKEILAEEKKLLQSEEVKGFVNELDLRLPGHEFSLQDALKVFDVLKQYFRPKSETDKMVDYLEKVLAVSGDLPSEDFTSFLAVLNNYHDSLKFEEYDHIIRKVKLYQSYSSFLNTHLEIMESINREDEVRNAIYKAAIDTLKNSVIESDKQLIKFTIKAVEESVQAYLTTFNEEEIGEIEGIIGHKLSGNEEENVKEDELHLTDNSGDISEEEKPEQKTADVPEETKVTEVTLDSNNEETLKALMKLAGAGKISNVLALTEEEKELVLQEVFAAHDEISKDDMFTIFSNIKIDTKLVNLLIGEKNKYSKKNEVAVLTNILHGDLTEVFPEGDSDGKYSMMYEEFNESIMSFLEEYEQEDVGQKLKETIVIERNYPSFKKWAVQKYLYYIASKLITALQK